MGTDGPERAQTGCHCPAAPAAGTIVAASGLAPRRRLLRALRRCCWALLLGAPAVGGQAAGFVSHSGPFSGEPGCGTYGSEPKQLVLGQVAHNDLAGKGPDIGLPHSIQYRSVASVEGQCVQLEVSPRGSDDDYSPKSSAENGVNANEGLGQLSVLAGTTARLLLRLVHCESRRPAQLSNFNLTFYRTETLVEYKITVGGYSKYFLQEPQLFQKAYTEIGTTFSSKAPCMGALGSQECGLTFLFQAVNEISITLQVLVGRGPEQIFYFGGAACEHLSNQAPATGPPCSPSDCGMGYELRPATQLPVACKDQECTEEECCQLANGDLPHQSSWSATPSIMSCKGHERSWHICDDLPECHPCVPKDCGFGDWSDWASEGGCSGLCGRKREVFRNNECGSPCQGATQETVSRLDDPACYDPMCKEEARDCSWGAWSEWTMCREECPECMRGQSFRFRNTAVQQNGQGLPCTGSWNETRPCQVSEAIDCRLSGWGEWTECSLTCGTGWRVRMRRIVQEAKYGGKPCGIGGGYSEGEATRQTAPCNTEHCGVSTPCIMDEWNDWTACDPGKYQKFRSRSILAPATHGGRRCDYPLNETAGCPVKLVLPPPNCTFSEWSYWSECSASCGGQAFRGRTVEVKSGEHCVLEGGGHRGKSLHETHPCGKKSCFEDKCKMSEWSSWSPCSAQCGTGMRTRSRNVTESHVKGCNAALTEAKACSSGECGKLDCEWGTWESWGACTRTCGGGTKRRSRVIKVAPRMGGKLCDPEAKSEVGECATQSCEVCIDGTWGSWSEWGACSASCAPAYRVRHRDVERHPNSCGKPATGIEDEYGLCTSLEKCDADQDCEVSHWGPWSDCSCKCFGVMERQRHISKFAKGNGKPCHNESLKEVAPCNPKTGQEVPQGCGPDPERSCVVAHWEEWTKCSVTCGGGQKSRYRHILSPAANKGPPCNDSLAETIPCNVMSCTHEHCRDCAWGLWSDWGDCTQCGGQRFRHRSVATLPNHCGKKCEPGDAKELGKCTSACEKTYFCVWSKWESMSDCASCGHTSKMRQRQLTLVQESPGANSTFFVAGPNSPCNGNQIKVDKCPYTACEGECKKRDCHFAAWAPWSKPTCAQLCERRRSIGVEAECGGRLCEGPLLETKRCKKDCSEPVDCALGDWAPWHPAHCSSKTEQRFRAREVLEHPRNGGAVCDGVMKETSSCSVPSEDIVDCQMEHWTEWTRCTKSCGGGLKTRTRKLKVQASGGGNPCASPLEELEACNDDPCDGDRVDCLLGMWGGWSSCEQAVMKYRFRHIEQEPSAQGMTCQGSLREGVSCNAVVDCRVSAWTSWDACDKTCGGGQRTRQRAVMTSPANGGKVCPPSLVETEGCALEPCKKRDCIVSSWSAWSESSSTCGAGFKTRLRSFVQKPYEGGNGCHQDIAEVMPTKGPSCGCKNCLWGEWEHWSDCSTRCDGGQRTRERHIIQEPDPGCKPCESKVKQQIEACNLQACHEKQCIDGRWHDWSDWEVCSASCEGGMTWRSRSVQVEANDCGAPAEGLSMEHEPCNRQVPCTPNIDCQLDEWTAWSTCSDPCVGVKRRSRVIKVHGQGKGAWCEGPLKETRPCTVSSRLLNWKEPGSYLDLMRVTNNNFGFAGPGKVSLHESLDQALAGEASVASYGGDSRALPPTIRYRHVAELPPIDCSDPTGCPGRAVDLVVSPKSKYEPCDVQSNGKQGHTFGAINVLSDTSIKVEFMLVDAETGKEVTAQQLAIKIYDLDAGAAGSSKEQVLANGFEDYYVTDDTSITAIEHGTDGGITFEATMYGTSEDNPTGPMETTLDQEGKAVALLYHKVSKVEMTLSVSAGMMCKTFLFAARACISGECKADTCHKVSHPPVDCVLSIWDAWGPCDAKCGVGQKIRTREVLKESANGGYGCRDALSETERCEVEACQGTCTPVNCLWEAWGEWSACDKCGGQMRRFRHIAAHPACGGQACQAGDAEQIAKCPRVCHDKSYCTWSTWEPWTACSATCGTGLKSRDRHLQAAQPPESLGDVTARMATDDSFSPFVAPELERKFTELHLRAHHVETGRIQALALAFASGSLSLVAMLAALRGCSRRRWRGAQDAEGAYYGQVPTESPTLAASVVA